MFLERWRDWFLKTSIRRRVVLFYTEIGPIRNDAEENPLICYGKSIHRKSCEEEKNDNPQNILLTPLDKEVECRGETALVVWERNEG